MAITGVTARGSQVSNTSTTTLSMNPTANLTVGKYVVVSCASDNNQTTDGISTFHTVQCSQNNVWTRLGEYTETDGAADDGVTVSIWGCKVTTQISTTDTITLTLGAAKTDKIITCFECSIGAGSTMQLAQLGVGQGAISASVTGLTSREYLLIGAIGSEGEDSAKTPDADYAEQFDLITSTTGNLDVNIAIHVQTRVATLTSDTCASSAWTFTNAMALLAAVYEAVPVNIPTSVGALTLTGFEPTIYKAPAAGGIYRPIVIDYTKVGATHTDFPVLISGTYSYLKTVANGGKVQNANGYDIVFFADSALTQILDFQIEKWSATTGDFVAWVKIPSLSNTVDTTIYLNYGNTLITTDQSDSVNVWDTNFKGVWHFPDGSTLTSPSPDSTSNANNGTFVGTPTATTGKIGGGISFASASSQALSLPNNSSFNFGTSGGSISAWIKTSTTGSLKHIIHKQDDGNSHNPIIELGINTSNQVFAQVRGNTNTAGNLNISTATTVTDGNWHFIVMIFDDTNNSGYIYIDNTLSATQSTTATTTDVNFSSANPSIGRYSQGWIPFAAGYFNGQIDEVRISTTPRSTAWFTTEYNSQGSPSTFYSVGTAIGDTGTTISTSVGQLDLTGFAPTITATANKSIGTSLGELTLTGFAPLLPKSVTTNLGELTLNGFNPTVTATDNKTITTALGALDLNGFSPTVNATANVSVTADFGVLTLNGFAPTVTQQNNITIATSAGQLDLNGLAPSVAISAQVNTLTGELSLTGFEPTISFTADLTISTSLGELTLTGLAPTANAQDNKSIGIDVGALTITGFNPTASVSASRTIITQTGELLLNGFSPLVIASDNKTITTSLGQLSLTGLNATVNQGANKTITTGVGVLQLSGFAVSVNASNNIVITSVTGALTLDGFVSSVIITENKTIETSVGVLTLTGFSSDIQKTYTRRRYFITS